MILKDRFFKLTYKVLIISICFCLFFQANAYCAEHVTNWRPTYDKIMLWFNFLLLVFIIVKFGKKPLIGFLKGQGQTIADEIGQYEAEKDISFKKLEEIRTQIDESEAKFNSLKERIQVQGEKEKDRIISEAHSQCEIMLAGSKQKIGQQISEAKNTLRAELIDSAYSLAMDKLPKKITKKDTKKFTDQFIASADAVAE